MLITSALLIFFGRLLLVSLIVGTTGVSLIDLLKEYDGNLFVSRENFVREYESMFSDLKSNYVSILEMGTDSPGFLKVVSKYFYDQGTFTGFIMEKHCLPQIISTTISLLCSDESNELHLSYDALDVIVDRFSKDSSTVFSGLSRNFRLLRPGGYYIIENIHSSFTNIDRNSFHNSTVEGLKNLAEIVNFFNIPEYDGHWENIEENERYFANWIHSITFLDGMAIIRKLYKPTWEQRKNVLTGKIADISQSHFKVAAEHHWERNTLELEDLDPWSSATYALETERRHGKGGIQSIRSIPITADRSASSATVKANREKPQLSLMQIFKQHQDRMCLKWDHYLPEYNRLFHRLRGTALSFLEIGVFNGGSAQIWRKFFGNASSIYGVDINPLVCELPLEEGITFYCVDATNTTAAAASPLLQRTYEVVLDDGSHQCTDVAKTFEILFPYVTPGGYYVIEDVHTSYWESFGGSLHGAHTTVTYFKRLVDIMHYTHLPEAQQQRVELDAFMMYCSRWIERIQFIDSIIVIKKHVTPKLKPYNMVAAGKIAALASTALEEAIEGGYFTNMHRLT